MHTLNRVMTEATKARERLNDAERTLNAAEEQLEKSRKELADLFDPAGYGPEGEWKKLQNTCLTKDSGE
jgi:protein kinase C substrate 80K-H